MTVKKVKRAWYGSYSDQSIVVIELQYDEKVWLECFNRMKEIYDKEMVVCPKLKASYKEELKSLLEEYLERNFSLLVEVPTVKKVHNEIVPVQGNDAYYIPQPALKNQFTLKKSIVSNVRVMCRTTRDLINEAYQLQWKKASELFGFIITTTDRFHNPSIPSQLPIAYALKGFSMTTDTLRKMMDIVLNKCQEYGINVLCICTDGQWAKNCL